MNKEPTIDQMNEAIALFMGYERYEDKYGIWFKKEGLIKCLHHKLQDLQYHASWDWLMPVIAELKERFKQTIKVNEGITNMHNVGINFQLAIVNISSAHLAAYHAIKWLNQQPQNQ